MWGGGMYIPYEFLKFTIILTQNNQNPQIICTEVTGLRPDSISERILFQKLY